MMLTTNLTFLGGAEVKRAVVITPLVERFLWSVSGGGGQRDRTARGIQDSPRSVIGFNESPLDVKFIHDACQIREANH